MSWKHRGPRGYHHGNLKEALIRAALELIAKKGPAGFTFAEAARFAGVSPAAPYRHFRDRDELLADDPPLRVFLKRFYDKALDLYFGDGPRGCYTVGTAATVAMVDDDVRKFLADRVRNADDFLKKQIEKGRERGEIARDADAAALAYLATGTLHTLAVRSRAGIPRKELEALAKAAIAVICGKPG